MELEAELERTAVAGTAALLAALPALEQLMSHDLTYVRVAAAAEEQLRQLSALVAPPAGLSPLTLHRWDVQPLPPSALHVCVFPPATGAPAAPALRELVLWSDHAVPRLQPDLSIDAAGLSCLAAAAPGLQRLHLGSVVAPGDGEALAALVRLQQRLGLHDLALGGRCVDDAAAGALAQMAGLRNLGLLSGVAWDRLALAPAFTAAGLQVLTGLRQLRRLACAWRVDRAPHPPPPASVMPPIAVMAPGRGPPRGARGALGSLDLHASPHSAEAGEQDVWEQLAESLQREPESWIDGARVVPLFAQRNAGAWPFNGMCRMGISPAMGTTGLYF